MYNRKSLAAALLLACAAGAGIVIACGPEFPPQLLDDRASTLQGTPANSFAYEAARLVPATDALRASESSLLPDGTYRSDAMPEDFDPALSAAQRDQIRAMRAQADGDQAYAAGKGLPEAVRLYAAAAVDYRTAPQARLEAGWERARKRLLSILVLPPDQAATRSVWAAYLLAEMGDAETAYSAPDEHSHDDSHDADVWRSRDAAAYARVRELALRGDADPLGLAVASYGQQARLYLTGAQGLCSYDDLINATACMDAVPAADLKQALHLYADQAARHSVSGRQSLRLLAEWALGTPARAARLVDDPIGQRLLVAYGLARVGDIVDGNPDSANDIWATFDATGRLGLADASTGRPNLTPNPALQSLVTALQTQDPQDITDADRVAALAYRVGRYDLAQGLADRLDTALAWWVRAKLAIRQGDTERAAQAYARAVAAFPRADGSVEPEAGSLLKAEQGVLSLSRGQYVEALDQLYRAASAQDGPNQPDEGWPVSPYWNDAAYVAERVLTTDELKAYVDRQAPPSPPPSRPTGFSRYTTDQFYEWSLKNQPPVHDRLRQLLARRLVRDGRVDESLPYFPADGDPRFAALDYSSGDWKILESNVRQRAAEYSDALQAAGNAWGRTTRAQAWYAAATLARRDGMRIMGYEQGPDYAVYDGSYAAGAGRDANPWWREAREDAGQPQDTPQQRAESALPGPFVTQEERVRYAASEAKPDVRYHYRQIAADYALKAADQLPTRSQAFAAVLCRGARYIIDDSPERATAIYLRYVDQGAQVPFSGTFGRECPEPDFQSASRFHYIQAWKAWERVRHQHPGLLLAGGLLALAAAAAGIRAWRSAAPVAAGKGKIR